jgi:hypothetical protein
VKRELHEKSEERAMLCHTIWYSTISDCRNPGNHQLLTWHHLSFFHEFHLSSLLCFVPCIQHAMACLYLYPAYHLCPFMIPHTLKMPHPFKMPCHTCTTHIHANRHQMANTRWGGKCSWGGWGAVEGEKRTSGMVCDNKASRDRSAYDSWPSLSEWRLLSHLWLKTPPRLPLPIHNKHSVLQVNPQQRASLARCHIVLIDSCTIIYNTHFKNVLPIFA